MDYVNFSKKCDDAIVRKDINVLGKLISEAKLCLEKNNLEHSQKAYLIYCLSNLYFGLSISEDEDTSVWRKSNKENKSPVNFLNSINCYRKAISITQESGGYFEGSREINTNLANNFACQRRHIEAFEYWRKNIDFELDGEAPYVASLAISRELFFVSQYLDDLGYVERFQYESYLIFKKLKSLNHKIDHPQINDFIENDSIFNKLLDHGDKYFSALEGWDIKEEYNNYQGEEKKYRLWCLNNKLFLNHLNDITCEWIASQDILQFPNHTVFIGDGPYYSAAFSSLKREYCFARFLLYEGINGIHSEFENKELFLTNTGDGISYDGATEKIKASFRVCFGVLDSLATLMEKYFQCNKTKMKTSFKPTWIEKAFSDYEYDNCFLDGLYWLSYDLNKDSESPELNLYNIRSIRNKMEHGWLRVVENQPTYPSVWNNDNDFAHLITLDDLKKDAITVLKLVRSAMIYFSLAVNFHEKALKSSTIVKREIPIFKDNFF